MAFTVRDIQTSNVTLQIYVSKLVSSLTNLVVVRQPFYIITKSCMENTITAHILITEDTFQSQLFKRQAEVQVSSAVTVMVARPLDPAMGRQNQLTADFSWSPKVLL